MDLFSPFRNPAHTLLAAVPVFLAGAYFDLTKFRLDPASTLAGSGPFLLVCRLLGGLLLALLFLALLRAGRDLLDLGRVSWKQMLALFLLLNGVTALYVATSQTVYVWDNAGYWTVARQLSQQWLGRSQLFEVLKSTISMDYNYLLAFPISLVMRLFGGSRAVFLFAIANLYTLPALWGLCALGKGKKWGGLTVALLFPMLTYIGLVGYVDVAAVGCAIWAVVIYTSDKPPRSRGVFSGFLLVLTFLLRRYFFFFAASFGVAALFTKILFDRKNWKDFLSLFFTSGVCAVLFTPNFLLDKVLGTDYGDLYSAYNLGLRSDFFLFCRYFGLAVLVALVACGVIALAQGEARAKVAFGLIQLAVCFMAFVMVQSHGQQHLLMYLPCLGLLAASALTPGVWSMVLAAVVFGGCFLPREQPSSIGAIKQPSAAPTIVFYGPRREDLKELERLVGYVDGLSDTCPSTAVVLASSFTLNSETLTNLRPSLGMPEPENRTVIQYHGTVDKRDPFNWNTLTADYLVIGDPVQTHLGEENQQVMALFAHDVLDGTGPGMAYRPLEAVFRLENGCTVRIYERTRDLTQEEYYSISDRLQALYPEYAELYGVPGWMRVKTE